MSRQECWAVAAAAVVLLVGYSACLGEDRSPAMAGSRDVPAALLAAAPAEGAQPPAAEDPHDWPARDLTFAADYPPKTASQPSAQAKTAPAVQGRRYVPWRQRTGPAYPGEFWTSFGRTAGCPRRCR